MIARASHRPSQATRDSWFWWYAGAIAIAAFACRLPSMFTDFWLDEIWSYNLARHAGSIAAIFVDPALKIDNNHQLNTLLLYLIGDQQHWALYRIPSLIAGVLTVLAACAVGSRRSRAEGVLSGLAVALSFIMVVYSTEARGYALVLLFALLAFSALRTYLDDPTLVRAAVFWLWIVLGLASQTSILHFYLGALLWSGYRLRGNTSALARLHLVPVAYGAVWAAVVLLGSTVGGGPPWTWASVGDQSLAWTFGYPSSVVPAFLAAGAALALVAWDAKCLWREGSDEGLFTIGAIVGPPIFMAALSPPWLFPRYFLISLLFLLLVAARSLARLWQRNAAWSTVAVVLATLLFALGNFRYSARFATDGRGHASTGVREMQTPGPAAVFVTGRPVDLRVSLPLQFYDHVLGLGDHLRYVPRLDADAGHGPGPVEWLVVTSEGDETTSAVAVTLGDGGRYLLERDFPATGPSGIEWRLYRRASRK